MALPAIKVDDLWKAYRVGIQAAAPGTLYDMLADTIRAPVKQLRRGSVQRASDDSFWALHGISFEVGEGQVVGVIGRNGAGKSTLLKILSRITAPTRGRVEIRGRLASLLEVGTGFHPELTGRENIFLNGAILGMKRSEVLRKFDEIVAFAEIEGFLDTPVKRYSSGMYVRLAFAVAAHLEPDIMVVDEVLAVGDAQFQKKCLAKIEDVAGHGRTVLFVSHNMAAIQSLCPATLLLSKGVAEFFGPTSEAVARYAAFGQNPASKLWERATASEARLAITRVESTLAGEQPRHQLELNIELKSQGPHKPSFLAIDVLDTLGLPIMQALPLLQGFIAADRDLHDLQVTVDLPPLVPGVYYVSVWVGPHNTETLDLVQRAISFEVTDSPSPGRTFPHSVDHGHIVPASTVIYGGTA
jgi:lipopolysaccharide transport system ATP-binding protein